MTVKKLLIISVVILCSVFLFTKITATPYNRFTHACVQNINQYAFEVFQAVYGPGSNGTTSQEQRYCESGYHPELTKKWETINRYLIYSTLAVTTPVIICTAFLLNSRRVIAKIKKAANNG